MLLQFIPQGVLHSLLDIRRELMHKLLIAHRARLVGQVNGRQKLDLPFHGERNHVQRKRENRAAQKFCKFQLTQIDVSLFGTKDQDGNNRALGFQSHADKPPFEILQLVHFAARFKISLLPLGKNNDRVILLQGRNAIFISGLRETHLLRWYCGGFGEKPQMMGEDQRNPLGLAVDRMGEQKSVKTRIARMIRGDDRSAPPRDVFRSLNFQSEVFPHDLHQEVRKDAVDQSLFIELLELKYLLTGLAEKIDHGHLSRGGSVSGYIMAIDQGTTGSQVLLVNSAGQVVASESQDYPQIFPKPGWVEHDPEAIWTSVTDTIRKLFKNSGLSAREIRAIGITNQRETVLFWDRQSGRPEYNAIVWQCRRTSALCEKLKKKKGLEARVKRKTGLLFDPYFSGTKMQWLLENVANLRRKAEKGQALVGTIDSFLLWRLSGGQAHKTDVSNASRTLLMNIKTGSWDEEMLKLFKVPGSCLPEISDSSGVLGYTKGLDFLPDGIPVAGMAGDQQAALFGQTCFRAGEAKCTFGTGSFLLMNTGTEPKFSKAGLLSTVAWRLKGQKMYYALEGGAFVCGAAVQWLRDGLGIIQKSADVEDLAKQVNDSGGVQFVPALTGLGAPYWWPEARGLLCGLTRGSTKAHIARATLEAMALQNVEILIAMQKDLGKKLGSLRVDGGATENATLMQMQADMLGVRVERPRNIETTALGAAFLAGLGCGFWQSQEELRKVSQIEKEFKVQWNAKLRKERLAEWQIAVQRAR